MKNPQVANENNKAGYVYVLSNPAMPGIVKIGMSSKGGRIRAHDIYKAGGTGIPMPYKMEFEIWSLDCRSTEQYIHEELGHLRINPNREFFKMDIDVAIEVIMRTVGYDYNFHVGMADTLVDENTLLESYGKQVAALVDELFPGCPPQLVLSSAIGSYLDTESVIQSLHRYKKSCDRQRLDLDSSKSNA